MQDKSYSQLGQDLWVVEKTAQKSSGYFVEAGACDGLHLSNTLLLERNYNWTGICCEPNPRFYKRLISNRQCHFDQGALYDSDDELVEFYAAGENGGTLVDFQNESKRLERRLSFPKVQATTISLNTLLRKHNAPSTIDYISLDTEGSEHRILEAFDFSQWEVRIFSIEHNTQVRDDGTDYLDKITELMASKGYHRELNQWDAYFYL